jgi:peptidoglycan hydrolase CwlO-like protein
MKKTSTEILKRELETKTNELERYERKAKIKTMVLNDYICNENPEENPDDMAHMQTELKQVMDHIDDLKAEIQEINDELAERD